MWVRFHKISGKYPIRHIVSPPHYCQPFRQTLFVPFRSGIFPAHFVRTPGWAKKAMHFVRTPGWCNPMSFGRGRSPRCTLRGSQQISLFTHIFLPRFWQHRRFGCMFHRSRRARARHWGQGRRWRERRLPLMGSNITLWTKTTVVGQLRWHSRREMHGQGLRRRYRRECW